MTMIPDRNDNDDSNINSAAVSGSVYDDDDDGVSNSSRMDLISNDDNDTQTTIILNEIEQLASTTVYCIQTIIDEIRTMNEFKNSSNVGTSSCVSSSTIKKSILPTSSSTNGNSPIDNNHVHLPSIQLYKHLCSTKVRDNNNTSSGSSSSVSMSVSVSVLLPEMIQLLQERITKCLVDLDEKIEDISKSSSRSSSSTTSNGRTCTDPVSSFRNNNNNNNINNNSLENNDNDIYNITLHITLPLLNNLTNCYTILDKFSTSSTNKQTKSIQNVQKQSLRTVKPLPPIGLLSLQNYTDIACIIEFTICSTIVPFVDSGILQSISYRCSHTLPKSLLGRIPRTVLLWGYSNATTTTTTTTSTNNSNEIIVLLPNVISTIGHLLLLDRFRPILLPRHLPDLYAAILQYDHHCHHHHSSSQQSFFENRQQHNPKEELEQNDRNHDDDDYNEYQLIVNRLMIRNMNQCQTTTFSSSTSINNTSSNNVVVDTILQAKAYQTLLVLVHANANDIKSSVLWYRQALWKQLSILACYDLSCLITVFVHSIGFVNNNDTIAASQRLAKAIVSEQQQQQSIATSTTTIPINNNDNNKHDDDDDVSTTLIQSTVVGDVPNTDTKKLIHSNNNDSILSDEYYYYLTIQIRNIIDGISQNYTQLDNTQNKIQSHHTITLQSIMSIIDMFPVKILNSIFFTECVTKDICCTSSSSSSTDATSKHNMRSFDSNIHHVIKRFGLLLGFITSTMTTTTIAVPLFSTHRICNLFVQPLFFFDNNTVDVSSTNIQLQQTTLLSLCIRIVSTSSILKSKIQTDTIHFLQLIQNLFEMSQFTLINNSRNNNNKKTRTIKTKLSGYDVFATSLFHVLFPSTFDFTYNILIRTKSSTGNRNASANDSQNTDDVLEIISFTPIDSDYEFDTAAVVDKIESCVKVVCQICKLKETASIESVNTETDLKINRHRTSAFLFRILLLLYLAKNDGTNSLNVLIPIIYKNSTMLHLINLIALPIVCEEISTEGLLSEIDDNDGIMNLMGIIFNLTTNQIYDDSVASTTDQDLHAKSVLGQLADRWKKASIIACPKRTGTINNVSNVNSPVSTIPNIGPEVLMSLASIMTTMLITILELGNKKRSVDDEFMLQSFIPMLTTFASRKTIKSMDSDSMSICTNLAEIASHCVALIVSRSVTSDDDNDGAQNNTTVRTGHGTSFHDTIRNAENDLKSTEPPIRARGIVSLRRLTHAVADQVQEKRPLISLIQEDSKSMDEPNSRDTMFMKMFTICLKALDDRESYVYLAAIHTIATICEANVKVILPLLAEGVNSGTVQWEEGENKKLSLEQRVKLTESLIFIIRRRSTLYAIAPYLINLMIYGSNHPDHSGCHDNSNETIKHDASLIQQQTHEYFLHGKVDESYNEKNDDSEHQTIEEQRNEMKMRLKTGGPLFVSEEGDVVRAARINVVAQIVTSYPTYIVAPYCSILVQCIIDVLRWESSRPVCRAGAALAQELYSAVRQEYDNIQEQTTTSNYNDELDIMPMTISLTASKEETMYVVLQNCITGHDTSYNTSNGIDKRFDPATIARCQEAIDVRKLIESDGLLLVGKLFNEKRHRDSKHALIQLLREPSQSATDTSSTNNNSNLLIRELVSKQL